MNIKDIITISHFLGARMVLVQAEILSPDLSAYKKKHDLNVRFKQADDM